MTAVRGTLAITVAAVCVLLPGVAAAKSFTAAAGGVTATLSYLHGPGPETTDERLQITAPGLPAYDQPVPAEGCFKVCGPVGTQPPVQVVDLYGDGQYEVVLNLFTGGASCCGIEQVYAPSSAVRSWVLTERNFGQDGTKLVEEAGKEVFLSGDNAFSCTFADCAQSGLPLQVFSFTGEAFHNVTKRYPELIARDAQQWLKAYYHEPRQGQGLIAAWAADEDNLGLEDTVSTVLERQYTDGNLTLAFVRHLQAFLKKHGYLS